MFFNGLTPSEDKCCGCEGCVNICPKAAISMNVNEDGFLIPQVNPDLCIECGLCEKVCPMQHVDHAVSCEVGVVYAAVSKKTKELAESSSGGVFSLVADFVLTQGGVICGAAFDENLHLNHIIVTNGEVLSRLRGSKYLQSRIGEVYKAIREILKSGKLVYFVGTGCQVAGLRLFLRKEYENLITSDILCHGVPPQCVFSEMIREVEKKYGGKVKTYSFRDKSVWGWSCSSSSKIEIKGRIKYLGNEPLQQAYFNAFIKGDNYRGSCYVCPYARSQRAGDITLGDYWGAEKYIPLKDIRKGVSAIIVNTPKGQRILDIIKEDLILYETALENVKVINKTLEGPTPRPAARDDFFNKFRQNPEQTFLSYYTPNKKRDLVYSLKKNPVTSKIIDVLKKVLKK